MSGRPAPIIHYCYSTNCAYSWSVVVTDTDKQSSAGQGDRAGREAPVVTAEGMLRMYVRRTVASVPELVAVLSYHVCC